MKAAVIGIGSNSVRMLVFELENGTAARLRRDREGTRLFAGLDAAGRLSAESMEKTVAAVARMADAARSEGAREVRLFATSATRDAANRERFAALLAERAGLQLEVCSGELEAALSFLGATDGGFSGVIDIGGGSTEIVTGRGTDLDRAFSCQMGAVRLSRQLPITCAADTEAVRALATRLLEEKLAALPDKPLPGSWFGTGGTFTTLAALVLDIPWQDRSCLHGTLLTREAVDALMLRLADMTVAERLRLPSLQPNRADIIVHGICILSAVMARLDIASLRVSEYGNLDGYVAAHYGVTLTGKA